uniref:RING-type E3 ubiquitin transferase n=1 Tax=Ditylum brightwellii TaxID=49249 RepID=A0A7S2EMZ2_9STRA|mmetsp:Transcript_356/g.545  ORF Transcript_356/g.545 Transcript_356/m.545 type:complete len:365 (+) Transcript_356:649-1743(+)
MFRKPKKSSKASFRKRGKIEISTTSDDDDDEEKKNRSIGRKTYRKRTNDNDKDDSSDDGGGAGGGNTSALLEQIRKDRTSNSKKRRLGGGVSDDDEAEDQTAKKGVMQQYKSSDHRMTAAEMATRAAEYHPTEITLGASTTTGQDEKSENSTHENSDGKIYRGAAAGTTRNKFLAGPMKAPTFVRTTCRFDYQPDICKDYKDTGFCGYGDTCIYLHDRGDTLTGWQLEKQWEDQKKKEREEKEKEMDRFLKQANASASGDGEIDGESFAMVDDGIPFACHICRGPFMDPVVTSCGHYFCEKCIMERVRGASSAAEAADMQACPICGKGTNGVFNYPTKLVAKKRRALGRDGTWEDFANAARGGK